MSNWLFSNLSILEKGLNAAFLRNQVIADNIANIDTPGYKAKKVEFESILKDCISQGAENSVSFKGKKTNPRHMDIGTGSLKDIKPVITRDNNTSIRMDGNNVNIDAEMVELSRNTILYNALVQKTGKELARLKTAVREVR